MAIGYFIGVGDKTTCGGEVLGGDDSIIWDGLIHAHEGDPVSCGKDRKTYQIAGGFDHFVSNGQRVAGTLHSVSGCPCKATLRPSVFAAQYSVDLKPSVQTKAKAPPAAPPYGSSTPVTHRNRGFTNHFAEIEEEEEEVELEQLITLRLGVFFDGTGNNQANSESVAGCMARDVGLEAQGTDIQRFCAEHGYGVDGSTPDNSYGNDTSNIARLYDLYEDQADVSIGSDAKEASLAVYLEGIGTVSGGEDDRYGQVTGRWGTGVLARVQQSSELIIERLDSFIKHNPDVKIKGIEVDVFGFSRGAAAARHFANDLHKGANSLLARALPAASPMLVDGFAWQVQRDITLNFIGLFDTVAGIVSPLVFDFSPGNARVSGLDLALPANVARKVVQLVARDEHRLNFALIRTEDDIILPGAHSDIGGGYLPRSRERLLISKPLSSIERADLSNERSTAFFQFRSITDPRLDRLIEHGIEVRPEIWSVDQRVSRDDLYPEKRVYVAAQVDREVNGDLSKIYLRVMRELGVRHGVPFDSIEETDQRFALPDELILVAEKLKAHALGKSSTTGLTTAEESLLFRRYIHFSSNWNAVNDWKGSDLDVVFINRPADDYHRVLHANE